MMAIIRGVVLIYTGGKEITLLFDDPAKEAAYKFFGGGKIFFLPVPLLLMVSILILFFVILRFTPFGRHICAIGSNEQSAITSGLNVSRIKIAVFALVGLTAGIAAVIRTSQLSGVSAGTAGLGLELEAISVVVLGGTSLAGGRGKLFGTMLAAILVAVAYNGLNLHETQIFYQYLVLGLILILAVSLDGLRRRFYQPAGIWYQG
jgi:ribose transport system permease protein